MYLCSCHFSDFSVKITSLTCCFTVKIKIWSWCPGI